MGLVLAIRAEVLEGAMGESFRFLDGGSLGLEEVEGLLVREGEVVGRRMLRSARRARLRDIARARSASRVILRKIAIRRSGIENVKREGS